LTPTPTRRDEAIIFVLLAVVLAPVVAVAVVGSYGFAIWMYQLLSGPPLK
jgi:periplasmic nitrate reductase NapE